MTRNTASTASSDPLVPRRAALSVLERVLMRGQTLERAVDGAFARAGLEGRDRAFARMVATTVLRRLGGLDRLLGGLLDRPLPPKAQRVRNVLRLGLAQLLYMDVPDHAAVDSSVALMEAASPYRALVNAVLRRAARERAAVVASLAGDPTLFLPDWLCRRWLQTYGEETTARIAAACLAEPPLDLTPRDFGNAEDLARRLGGTLLPNGSIRLAGSGSPETLPGFSEGEFWVQDAAASLAAPLLGGCGEVLDLCAAPGGKTLQLAARGARVTAVDRASARLALLRQNLARTGLAAEIVKADVLTWTPGRTFRAILLDAPCTATGTLRRHPDVGWLRSNADVAAMAALQARLLDRLADLLADGGMAVYCVCSLEREEGEERIESFLARNSDFRRLPVAEGEAGGLENAVTGAGDLRTLPAHWEGQGGLDGFYIARLVRAGRPVG